MLLMLPRPAAAAAAVLAGHLATVQQQGWGQHSFVEKLFSYSVLWIGIIIFISSSSSSPVSIRP
jgi:hypothetical protein